MIIGTAFIYCDPARAAARAEFLFLFAESIHIGHCVMQERQLEQRFDGISQVSAQPERCCNTSANMDALRNKEEKVRSVLHHCPPAAVIPPTGELRVRSPCARPASLCLHQEASTVASQQMRMRSACPEHTRQQATSKWQATKCECSLWEIRSV